jgi:intracellular sulfur oxidation DsrE/DsrF family protein
VTVFGLCGRVLLGVVLAVGFGVGAQAANPSMLDDFKYDEVQLIHPWPHAVHRLVVQISDDRPELWNMALNNIEATAAALGRDTVQVVVVTYGPGLKMLLKDSVAAERITAIEAAGVEFDACWNTMQGMAKATGKLPELLPVAVIVPSGVVRIMQLQTHGFAYLRP